MKTSVVKGDLGPKLYRQLRQGGIPVDLSPATVKILVSGANDFDPAITYYVRRDVTSKAKFYGTPSLGIVGIPSWSGRTLGTISVGSITITDKTVVGQAIVTAAAGPTGTVLQEIYTSKANDVNTTQYRVASGANGFASAGIAIGSATYPASNSVLSQLLPDEDQSATNGFGLLGTPTAPTVALGTQPGSLDNGTHWFALVNLRNSDVDELRTYRIKIIKLDTTTAEETTWPAAASSYEYLQVTEDIP